MTMPPPAESPPLPVTTLAIGGRTVHLLGTAHVSADSCSEVERAIRELRPDVVLVELDADRLGSLRDPDTWRRTDIRQVIRERRLPTLIAGLVLNSYQRRLGGGTGVRPGSELLRAVDVATAEGIPVLLCDRPIRKTLRRVWGSIGWWQRGHVFIALVGSLFSSETLSEEDLGKLKQPDSLNLMLASMGTAMPRLAHALVTERDWYMAEGIQAASGSRLLAVVGAAHVPGMSAALEAGRRVSLAELEEEPKPSWTSRLAFGGITALLLGSLAGYVVWRWNHDPSRLAGELRLWIICTSGPALLAALLARAHVLVVLVVVVLAPVATLLRVIPGPKLSLVSALLQAWLCPPTVDDMENVADHLGRLRAWWSNRLLRIFLVFALPGLATLLGALVALSIIAKG